MQTRQQRIAAWIICLLICAILFAAVWHRAYYGLDVTDESFSVAEPYLVLKGAIPYADLWSQTPSTSLLVAPFEFLYMLFTGGTEGLALFMILITVLLRLAVCVGLWFLLHKKVGDLGACAFAAAFFCFSSTGRGMNYNTLSLYLLALGGAMGYRILTEDDAAHFKSLPIFTGITMAACALAHSTQIVNCFYFALLFLFASLKGKTRKYKYNLLCYVSAGIVIALVTVIGIEISSKWRLFAGIRVIITTNNFFHIEKLSMKEQIIRSYNVMKLSIKPWLTGFLCFLAASLIILLLHRKKPLSARFCLTFALVGGGGGLFVNALKYGISRDRPTAVLFFTVPLFLFAVGKKRRRDALMLILCFWIPSLITLLLVAIASHSPADYRYFTLTAGGLLYIPLCYIALESLMVDKEEKTPVTVRILVLFPALLALLVSACFVKSSYETVYRDSPIRQMDYRVSSGVYKGLYTSRENGEAVEKLEKNIWVKTSGAESILICDLFPMGYLMTDAPYCTPSTWDPNMYRYKFQDMELFKKYFELKDQIPGMILYINSENIQLSIDDSENEFASFVKEHYTLTAAEGEGRYALRVFERNDPN